MIEIIHRNSPKTFVEAVNLFLSNNPGSEVIQIIPRGPHADQGFFAIFDLHRRILKPNPALKKIEPKEFDTPDQILEDSIIAEKKAALQAELDKLE